MTLRRGLIQIQYLRHFCTKQNMQIRKYSNKNQQERANYLEDIHTYLHIILDQVK